MRASGSGSRNSISGRRSTNATEADLLGVGPSRKLGKSITGTVGEEARSGAGYGTSLESTRSRRSWKVFLQSLSKEELAIIETDFESMPDDQLQNYLTFFDTRTRDTTSQLGIENAGDESQAQPINVTHKASPRIPVETDIEPPLFPPSPPGEAAQELVDHPLRILSRVVRELREVVESLEYENEKLRLLKEAGGVRGKRDRRADQVSMSLCTHCRPRTRQPGS